MANPAGLAYQDEYAALLSRLVEKGVKSPDQGDFLGPVEYWQSLWDRVSNTDTWTQMMDNAVLITKNTTEYNGSTGKTYALLTRSGDVAWLAFPGVSTDANMQSGAKGGFITWPGNGNTDAAKDVHQYFYAEWKALEGAVIQWLASNKANYSKLIVTGHSKGGVLSQYFLADYGDDLGDKAIHFTAFGSPNGGSEAFIKVWAGRSALKRAKFYTTYGDYKRPDSGSAYLIWKTVSIDDIISWKEADEMGGLLSAFGSGEKYYPRGLSRIADKYVAEYAANLSWQKIKTSSGSFPDYATKEAYALTIHDDSYYLSGMQDAYDKGQLDPFLPEADILYIRLAKDQDKCVDLKKGNTANGANIQLVRCKNIPAQQWMIAGSGIRLGKSLNKCIDLSAGNTANGTNIQLWDCNGAAAQQWIYDVANKMIRSGINVNKCLDLVNGNTADGTNIQIYDCVYGSTKQNQQWAVDGVISAMPAGTNKRIRLAADTGMCADVKAAATANGTNIQLYHCHTANNSQYFIFNGHQVKMQAAPDKCLDLNQSKTNNGNNVQLWDCNGTDAQNWIYDGFTQAFRSAVNPSKCLDVDHSNFSDGTNIQLWDCNGTAAQQFEIGN